MRLLSIFGAVALVLLVAFLFYGLIPGIGAFAVRAEWRSFRRRILRASLFPFVQYSELKGPDRTLGEYRFFGELEAIQGENRVWITDGRFTVEADLGGVSIYMLPSAAPPREAVGGERLAEAPAEEEPRSVLWRRIYSLPSGTPMFVGGSLELENGRAVFRGRPREPLAVVIYDGPRQTILSRTIGGGRQKNEYWNRFTLAALITGSFSLFVMAFLLLRFPLLRLPAILALTLSMFPVAVLLPPGVALYFLYRSLWKKARQLRAERDLLILPLRYFQDGEAAGGGGSAGGDRAGSDRLAALPTCEPYLMTRATDARLEDGLAIRGSELVPRLRRGEYTLFGVPLEGKGSRILGRPEDPMAELVLILGDPEALSRACKRWARNLEILSALSILGGVAVNLFLILYALTLLIR